MEPASWEPRILFAEDGERVTALAAANGHGDRWRSVLGTCPVCSEFHYFDENDADGTVSCGYSRFVGNLDDLAEELAEREGTRKPPLGEDPAPPAARMHGTRTRSLAALLADPELLRPPTPAIPRFAWPGRTTVLTGREKLGKSTAIAAAVAAYTNGAPFVGGRCDAGRAVIASPNQPLGDTVRQFADFGARGDAVELWAECPTAHDLMQALTEAHAEGYGVFGYDALVDLLEIEGVKDENDAAGVQRVLGPIVRHVRTLVPMALIFTSHARKSDGTARGSTAIAAAVDVELNLRAPKVGQGRAVRRVEFRGRLGVGAWSFQLRDDGEHKALELVADHDDDAEDGAKARILAAYRKDPDATPRTVAALVYRTADPDELDRRASYVRRILSEARRGEE